MFLHVFVCVSWCGSLEATVRCARPLAKCVCVCVCVCSQAAQAAKAPQPAKLAAPKEAQGSAWNANNYHFEEQRLDAWGRERLKELLKAKVRETPSALALQPRESIATMS